MFWQDLWNSICNFFNDLGQSFVTKDQSGWSTLSRIVVALMVLVLGSLLIKLVFAVIKKASGIKRGIKADFSIKHFTIATIRVVFYVGLAIIVVGILGFDIAGVAGIASAVTVAIGLAIQDIIGMFASGILLLNVKNFKTGDYVKIANSFGQEEGKVYKVSLFYTTLVTVNGQKISIPNNNVTKANVTNYTENDNRRGVISICVPYTVPTEKVKEIMTRIAIDEERVLESPNASAVVGDMRDFGVQYDLRFFTTIDDYWDTLFDLRAKIVDEFQKEGITVARNTDITIKHEESTSSK